MLPNVCSITNAIRWSGKSFPRGELPEQAARMPQILQQLGGQVDDGRPAIAAVDDGIGEVRRMGLDPGAPPRDVVPGHVSGQALEPQQHGELDPVAIDAAPRFRRFVARPLDRVLELLTADRKSTRLNSSHGYIS